MKPQTKQVLEVLRSRGSITDAEAFTGLHIRRLAARVHELRKWHGIEVERVWERNRNGRHARYVLRQVEVFA